MRRFLILSSLVAGLATALLYRHDMARTRARLKAAGTVATTSFGPIEYACDGNGAPVLVLHGAGGGFDQGLAMTQPLSGYRRIAPSRFGYLRTALPADHGAAAQADAYASLLDHLGIDAGVVLGISAGAWSALQFAARHPTRCRALVLLVPAAPLPKGVSVHGGLVSRMLFHSDLTAWILLNVLSLVPSWASPLLGTPRCILNAASASEKRRIRQILWQLFPIRTRAPGMQSDIATAAAPDPCPLAAITCPVLTISAQDDLFGTAARAKEIAALVRHGRAVTFPTGGHALVGRQTNVLREIRSFLKHSD